MAGKEDSVQEEYMFSRSFRDSARQVLLSVQYDGIAVLTKNSAIKIAPPTLDLERASRISFAPVNSSINLKLQSR